MPYIAASGPSPARRAGLGRVLAIVVPVSLALVLLLADRLPRFYQGDSIAYLATGLSGWIPPDRSWAYGFASRWIVEAARSAAALVAVQVALLVTAIVTLSRRLLLPRYGWLAALVFGIVATLDPLNETYARFWLSDVPASAMFLLFVALLPVGAGSVSARSWPALALLWLCVLLSVFLRVAYLPIELLTVLLCGIAARRDPAPGLRRRLAAIGLMPVAATVLLAFANARVAMPPLRGTLFINAKSSLYTMGVFLPALRYEDFVRAQVPITREEFDRLHLERYDEREAQMWGDQPTQVRFLMQSRLGLADAADPRFEKICAAVVHAGVLHHPQTFVVTYLHSLLLYLDPREWRGPYRSEMGFGRPLPDWVATLLSTITGRTVAPSVTAEGSFVLRLYEPCIGAYPLLLAATGLASIVLLLRARRLEAIHLVCAGLLASLLASPLYSHLVKPRYDLCTVTLAELLVVMLLFRWRATRQ